MAIHTLPTSFGRRRTLQTEMQRTSVGRKRRPKLDVVPTAKCLLGSRSTNTPHVQWS
ncbi:hypothetical protein HOLleu_38506 [Holothuria leucospilota]|uniref:Uncharacterized protein n=1 Tax=Holothuria leucospilota TaxID=206669 RepID=A0A9Q0YEF2_HOLLE|nr:hypothetical protein HOLleu_38506 [Holothuria leucospilota]